MAEFGWLLVLLSLLSRVYLFMIWRVACGCFGVYVGSVVRYWLYVCFVIVAGLMFLIGGLRFVWVYVSFFGCRICCGWLFTLLECLSTD